MVNRGIELRKAGDDRAALDAFERAYGLAPSAEARVFATIDGKRRIEEI